MNTIVIGARGSSLSRIQVNIIKELLLEKNPDLKIETKIIKTTGDKNLSPVPLDSIGKGWFTKEIDRELQEGGIDLAVHSLKDLGETLSRGLTISAIPEREDAREAFVSANGTLFMDIRKGAVIGTDSNRRKVQILKLRPDVVVKSVRGNVNRRIDKLDSGQYDGLILAVAGLKRLGLETRITQIFSPKEFIPSPGQGALAVVSKKSNKKLNGRLKKIVHEETAAAVMAERAFSKAMGGGCKTPVGSYAGHEGSKLILTGMIGSLDGKYMLTASLSGRADSPVSLGKLLAKKMLKQAPWYRGYAVVTRPASENREFIRQLQEIGLSVFSYPSITVKKNKRGASLITARLVNFADWFVFTSTSGVREFIERLRSLGIGTQSLLKKRIAAVGPKTAGELKKNNLPIHFIPSRYTTECLGKEMPDVKGKTLILPRSSIANKSLTSLLQKKGAQVIDIPIYDTLYVAEYNKTFSALLRNNQITCVTFTSPSTITGFMKGISASQRKKVLSVPVLSIGPVTTKAAYDAGFLTIHTAKVHTTEGMVLQLQESILL